MPQAIKYDFLPFDGCLEGERAYVRLFLCRRTCRAGDYWAGDCFTLESVGSL